MRSVARYRVNSEQLRMSDEGVAAVNADKGTSGGVFEILRQRLLIWHLDQLDLQRITLAAVKYTIPYEEVSAVVGQQSKDGVLEDGKIISATRVLPEQNM